MKIINSIKIVNTWDREIKLEALVGVINMINSNP